MHKLIAAVLCACVSIWFFHQTLEQLCKLSPRFRRWWKEE